MYAYFKGNVEIIYRDKVVLDVNGIGYEIYMPFNELEKLQENNIIKIYTYLYVREDEMKLFGFLSIKVLEFFKKLISVSGVGPKVALGIIASISVSDMCMAIATQDLVKLKKVTGIGPKMAQKIIFELKDKLIKDNEYVKENMNIDDAIIALQVLGYNQREINEVISQLNLEDETVETIIKKVLKEMQKL